MSPSVSHDAVGLVVADRYRLLARLGAGPSATVHLADDVRLRRRVAIKMLHGTFGVDDAFLDRFRIEVQSAAQLRHPHIAAVHDWGVDRVPFVVGDYFARGSLRALLDRGVVLDPPQLLQVALAAARALAYAHDRGVIHRDLRPENLLFGDDGRVQIADFGLARARAEAASTRPLDPVGPTAAYLAPEQVGAGAVDGRSDVYALAVVLVEATTARPPVPGPAEAFRAPPVPAHLGPMRDVLARASTVDQHERLDAAGFVTALMAVADAYGEPEPIVFDEPAPRDPGPSDDITFVGLPGERDDITRVGSPGGSDDVATPGAATPTDDTETDRTDAAVATAPASGAPPASPDTDSDDAGPTATGPSRHRRGRRLAWIVLAVVVVVGGAVVSYVVYQAQRTPTHLVPDLDGLTPAEATDRLTALGFDVATERIRRDDTVAGDLLDVDPASGTRLAEGRTVTLTVSDGPTLVRIPDDVAGASVRDATTALARLGLEVDRTEERHSEDVDEGAVIGTDPGAGTELEKGSPVTLIVSEGPEPRVIPTVDGRSPEELTAVLRDMGLEPSVTERYDTEVDTGGLIGMSPSPGTTVARGTTVELVVSKGLLVAVPELGDADTVAAAIEKLEAAGLTADELLGSGSLSGRPAAFDPPAGELVVKGSAVDIVVR